MNGYLAFLALFPISRIRRGIKWAPSTESHTSLKMESKYFSTLAPIFSKHNISRCVVVVVCLFVVLCACCVLVCGVVWLLCSCLWCCVIVCGVVWLFVVLCDCLWCCVSVSGVVWLLVVLCDCCVFALWCCVNVCGVVWLFVLLCDCYVVLIGSLEVWHSLVASCVVYRHTRYIEHVLSKVYSFNSFGEKHMFSNRLNLAHKCHSYFRISTNIFPIFPRFWTVLSQARQLSRNRQKLSAFYTIQKEGETKPFPEKRLRFKIQGDNFEIYPI